MGSPTLRIRLLGELDLRSEGVPLPPLESARAGSLLAYLLLHRAAPQPRQHLAFLLWPDSTESQARTNLRHVLHHLRHALPDPDRFLDVTAHTLQWRAEAPCWLDIAALVLIGRNPRQAALLAAMGPVLFVGPYFGDLLGMFSSIRAPLQIVVMETIAFVTQLAIGYVALGIRRAQGGGQTAAP